MNPFLLTNCQASENTLLSWLFLSVLIVVLLFSGVCCLSECFAGDVCDVQGSVVSRSVLSALSLSLQAVLLITVQALHLRELSIIVALYPSMSKTSAVKVALLLLRPLHRKDTEGF